VLSGRGLCHELITRPEESYRLCCVVVCDLETSRMGAPYIYDISHLRVNILCIAKCIGLINSSLGYIKIFKKATKITKARNEISFLQIIYHISHVYET